MSANDVGVEPSEAQVSATLPSSYPLPRRPFDAHDFDAAVARASAALQDVVAQRDPFFVRSGYAAYRAPEIALTKVVRAGDRVVAALRELVAGLDQALHERRAEEKRRSGRVSLDFDEESDYEAIETPLHEFGTRKGVGAASSDPSEDLSSDPSGDPSGEPEW